MTAQTITYDNIFIRAIESSELNKLCYSMLLMLSIAWLRYFFFYFYFFHFYSCCPKIFNNNAQMDYNKINLSLRLFVSFQMDIECTWMRETNIDWIFQGPACAVLLINLIFLFRIMWVSEHEECAHEQLNNAIQYIFT